MYCAVIAVVVAVAVAVAAIADMFHCCQWN